MWKKIVFEWKFPAWLCKENKTNDLQKSVSLFSRLNLIQASTSLVGDVRSFELPRSRPFFRKSPPSRPKFGKIPIPWIFPWKTGLRHTFVRNMLILHKNWSKINLYGGPTMVGPTGKIFHILLLKIAKFAIYFHRNTVNLLKNYLIPT